MWRTQLLGLHARPGGTTWRLGLPCLQWSVRQLSEQIGAYEPPELPYEHFNSIEGRISFVRDVAERLNLTAEQLATEMTPIAIVKHGGRSLLARYGGSVSRLLEDVLPRMGVKLTATKAKGAHRVPRGFWANPLSRREFLTHVAAVHGVKEQADWSGVTKQHIVQLGGGSFLKRYNDSIFAALKDAFPEQEFSDTICRPQVGRNHWSKPEKRRAFFENVASQFGVKRPSDWKNVTTTQVEDMGGSRLIRLYNGSLYEALKDTFPDVDLNALSCRPTKPRGYWDVPENRRAFMDGIARDFGVKSPKDWKKVTTKQVAEKGGGSLLQRHNGSLLRTLREVYAGETYQGTPIKWDAFTCRPNLPPGHWSIAGNVKELLDRAKAKFKVNTTKDWYRVSQAQIRQLQGGGLLRKMRFVDALRLAYPEEDFDVGEINKNVKKAAQRQMFMCSQRVFAGMEVVEDYRSEKLTGTEGAWPRRSLELDVYVPALEFGIEYNGEHHYHDIPFFGGLELYQRRDSEKRQLCVQKGIKLVTIPYWWDNTIQSFVASLYWAYPEVVESALSAQDGESGEYMRKLLEEVKTKKWNPIPRKPDASLNDVAHHNSVPSADQLWSGTVPRPVLVRVKTNGIRVVWNGHEGHLGTRFGRKILAPAWWKALLPKDEEIDGELFLNEQGATAGQLSGIIFLNAFLQRPVSEEDSPWKKIVFEATDVVPKKADADLSSRLLHLRSLPESTAFQPAVYVSCKTTKEVEDFRQHVANSSRAGATLLLREPRGMYEYAENTSTKLVRSTYETEMAVVGKSQSTRGMVVEGLTGMRQVVRCSAAVYDSPPPEGTVVTVGHYGRWPTTGRVKFPFFICSRPDLIWEAIVRPVQGQE